MSYRRIFQERGHSKAAFMMRALVVIVLGCLGAILQRLGVPPVGVAALLALGILMLTLNIFRPLAHQRTTVVQRAHKVDQEQDTASDEGENSKAANV